MANFSCTTQTSKRWGIQQPQLSFGPGVTALDSLELHAAHLQYTNNAVLTSIRCEKLRACTLFVRKLGCIIWKCLYRYGRGVVLTRKLP